MAGMAGATIPLSVHRLVVAGIKEHDARYLRSISMRLRRHYTLDCNEPNHPDYETNALKSLGRIMANYPTLNFYIQTDPRGTALYILRPGDIPAGKNPNSYYSNGIGVHK